MIFQVHRSCHMSLVDRLVSSSFQCTVLQYEHSKRCPFSPLSPPTSSGMVRWTLMGTHLVPCLYRVALVASTGVKSATTRKSLVWHQLTFLDALYRPFVCGSGSSIAVDASHIHLCLLWLTLEVNWEDVMGERRRLVRTLRAIKRQALLCTKPRRGMPLLLPCLLSCGDNWK